MKKVYGVLSAVVLMAFVFLGSKGIIKQNAGNSTMGSSVPEEEMAEPDTPQVNFECRNLISKDDREDFVWSWDPIEGSKGYEIDIKYKYLDQDYENYMCIESDKSSYVSFESEDDEYSYLVQVRAFRDEGGSRIYSQWSACSEGHHIESYTEFNSYEEFIDTLSSIIACVGTSEIPEIFYNAASGSCGSPNEGYFLKDIDGDGADEMIIGKNIEFYWEGPTEEFTEVDAIYKLEDGKMTEVEDGRFKGYCWIAKNGAIVSEGPMGAGSYFYTFYDYKKDKMIDEIYEEYDEENEKWHYFLDSKYKTEGTQEKEDEILAKYVRDRFELTPFVVK
ncbi:MAG: hypothetical protein J5802_08865 [Butyrivibrio sp.]|nr:hypothetical protein [Butyrivibrio sp.]